MTTKWIEMSEPVRLDISSYLHKKYRERLKATPDDAPVYSMRQFADDIPGRARGSQARPQPACGAAAGVCLTKWGIMKARSFSSRTAMQKHPLPGVFLFMLYARLSWRNGEGTA